MAVLHKRLTDLEQNEGQAGGSQEVNVNEAAAIKCRLAGRSSWWGMKSNKKKIRRY